MCFSSTVQKTACNVLSLVSDPQMCVLLYFFSKRKTGKINQKLIKNVSLRKDGREWAEGTAVSFEQVWLLNHRNVSRIQKTEMSATEHSKPFR